MLLVKVGHFFLSSYFRFKIHTSCLSCGILKPQGVSHVMQPSLLILLYQGAQWTDLRESSQIRNILFYFVFINTHLQNDNSAACSI